MQCAVHTVHLKMSLSYCAPYLDLGVMRWQDKRRPVANSTKALFGHVLKTTPIEDWINMESDKEGCMVLQLAGYFQYLKTLKPVM